MANVSFCLTSFRSGKNVNFWAGSVEILSVWWMADLIQPWSVSVREIQHFRGGPKKCTDGDHPPPPEHRDVNGIQMCQCVWTCAWSSLGGCGCGMDGGGGALRETQRDKAEIMREANTPHPLLPHPERWDHWQSPSAQASAAPPVASFLQWLITTAVHTAKANPCTRDEVDSSDSLELALWCRVGFHAPWAKQLHVSEDDGQRCVSRTNLSLFADAAELHLKG